MIGDDKTRFWKPLSHLKSTRAFSEFSILPYLRFIFQADKELKRRRTGSLDDEDDDEDEDEDEVDEGMDEGEGRLGR